MNRLLIRPVLCLGVFSIGVGSLVEGAEKDAPSQRLGELVPSTAHDFIKLDLPALQAVAKRLDERVARRGWVGDEPKPPDVLAAVRAVLRTKTQIDAVLQRTLRARSGFVEMAPGDGRRPAIQAYLAATSSLINLSGRLRYTLSDLIDRAAYELEPYPNDYGKLLDLLLETNSSIGAAVMTYVLFDPEAGADADPFSKDIKLKALRLAGRAGEIEVLDALSDFLRGNKIDSELKIAAVEAVRRLGLPQTPRPGSVADSKAWMRAADLMAIVQAVNDVNGTLQMRRAELVKWLEQRLRVGVTGESFRVCGLDVRAGDWFLMRNPSPYNLFTDLSPGLFTHAGVVTVEKGTDGVRRFVVTDLPERGDHVPATNVEDYLQRTLHFFFLRHRDAKVARKMSDTAATLIGNETQFDLTFRTSRVLKLKGKPLHGVRLNTYCAGYLLLCAQTTGLPRERFFPIEELSPSQTMVKNLKRMGLSIGDRFVSPTGAVFSPDFQLAGQRRPMYEPGREIRETIYDHFAKAMNQRTYKPSPDAKQALLQQLARLSSYNPWLAKALARANDVSEHLDLEAAAKAAAAVRSLDEVAEGAQRSFFDARRALQAGTLAELKAEGLKPTELTSIKAYRKTHAKVYRALENGALTPRGLRIELVRFYSRQGRRQLDSRFFARQ